MPRHPFAIAARLAVLLNVIVWPAP